MKSNIILIPTKDMSNQDWLNFRMCGVGASEVGIVLGLSPYKASIHLFYEKIGEIPTQNVENLASFLGKNQEDFIAEMWSYWPIGIDDMEGAQLQMMRNYQAGNQVRKCKRVNAYAQNPKYPFLFASLDREINFYVDEHGVLRQNGTLEEKAIGGWEAEKWVSGIPPLYVMQVQAQMLVCEYGYGKIAILRDNRKFYVLPFEKNRELLERIIHDVGIFWKKVEAGRILANQKFEAQRNFNIKLVEEIDAELASIEPEPDGSEAFSEYLKEKYKIALPGERPGNAIQLDHAQKHRSVKEKIKELEKAARSHENALKNDLGHGGADRLDFGPTGYISWKSDSNGVRRFLNKVK